MMRQLDPSSIVSAEETSFGWRALNKTGELLEVRSRNGSIPTIPDDVPRSPLVSEYLAHSERALAIYHAWDDWRIEAALAEIEAAIRIVPTTYARYHRALMLISLGRWREGFAEWETRTVLPNIHLAVPSRITYWRGEPLAGKRIVLVHEQGYGESIQQLRYVPMLEDMGADVVLLMPEPLQRLASQCAPLFDGDADYYSPALSLMHWLKQTPDTMPRGTYLCADESLVARWRARIGNRNGQPRVGIAWASGTLDDRFPRSAPLELFVQALPGAELFAIQQCGDPEQDDAARRLGVKTFTFDDFADVAALISLMDEVVTIDTAALHVAGALGHPNVTVLLPTYAAWRWQVTPGTPAIYPNVQILQQRWPGDWHSAFAKLRY